MSTADASLALRPDRGMEAGPLVSVCVPTRNRAPLLAEALHSALAQVGPALEVVVQDDASTDATRAVVDLIADPRLRYARNASPLGVALTRDRCLTAARGRYVAWLDSDDAYLPGALARQVAVLEAHPGASMVHGGFDPVDEAGVRLAPWSAPFAQDGVEPGAVAFRHLLASNEVATSTVVVRRTAHAAAGPFGLARLPSSSDWSMWLRLALQGDVAYTRGAVTRFRQHRETISHAANADGERLRCDVAVVRGLVRDGGVRTSRATLAAAYPALAAKALLHAGDLLVAGRRAESLRAVGLAVRLAPGPLAQLAPWLALSTARGDDYGCYRATKAMLSRLAARLDGTRYGRRVAAAGARDPAWEAALMRAARIVRRVVPAGACVGAVTKWDPTLLAMCHRRGRNFPDRRTLPDGYPADSAAAVEHLEEQRRGGLSHLVIPSVSFWWLEHYHGLATHLESHHRRLWGDEDCVVFDLGAGRVA